MLGSDLTRDQFDALYRTGGLDALWHLWHTTRDQLRAQVPSAPGTSGDPDGRVNRTSRHRSQPPASDGYRKPPPKSRRQRSGKKPGGQPGHPGTTLQPVGDPDETQRHPVTTCAQCGTSLADHPHAAMIRRQVFDLPPQRLHVTEHQAEVKDCPACGARTTAGFPPGVDAPAQYGPEVLGLAVYLHYFPRLPMDRLRELFRDRWGVSLSVGPLMRSWRLMADRLTPITESIRLALQQAPVVHPDETGMRVAGQWYWFHTVSTNALTFLYAHRQRGREAIDAMDILPHRTGTTVHDGLPRMTPIPDRRPGAMPIMSGNSRLRKT